MKITSQQFFQAWREIVEERKEILKTTWRNSTNFTATIRHNEDSVLNEIKNKLGLECYAADYYSLDAILYRKEDLVDCSPEGSTWVTGIAVAFEHENYFNSGLYKEVSHLLITESELKVIVTYPPNDEVEERELINLHKIIKGSRHSKERSDCEDFLLIFGYEFDFSWYGYVYTEEKWKELEGSGI